VGHAAAQPLQAPPVQVCGLAHCSHAKPPVPHALSVVPNRHVAPEQQPSHETASQTQTPPAQRWRGPQAAPVPQRHVPSPPQLSAVMAQATHVAPCRPHVSRDRVVHVAPAQHPPAHDVASQMQAPATQCWPGSHGARPPHWHWPLAAQVSARVASQAAQGTPPVPHVAGEGAVHTAPRQQPPAQVAAVQALHPPPLQISGATQAAHAPPPPPQAPFAEPGRQAVPAQQPPQDEESQTHAPLEQRCPVRHGGPSPHRQEPPVEQLSA
jgi:hypothetical protein